MFRFNYDETVDLCVHLNLCIIFFISVVFMLYQNGIVTLNYIDYNFPSVNESKYSLVNSNCPNMEIIKSIDKSLSFRNRLIPWLIYILFFIVQPLINIGYGCYWFIHGDLFLPKYLYTRMFYIF